MTTAARRVDGEDIDAFALLSGDHNRLHTDDNFAAASIFGQRVAHGLLGLSIGSGLYTETNLSQRIEPILVAMLGIEWKFRAPVFVGDELRLEVEVTDLRATRNPDRMVLVLTRRLVNQRGEVVQDGTTSMLLDVEKLEGA